MNNEIIKKIDYAKESEMLKALGHPVRLRIVCGLMCGDGCNVNKIVEALGLPQSTVSQHLGILRNQGIIDFQKDGVKTCYRVVDPRIKNILTELCKKVSE